MTAAGLLAKLARVGVTVEIIEGVTTLNDPHGAANDVSDAELAEHQTALVGLALSPRERVIAVLAHVEQEGVAVRLVDAGTKTGSGVTFCYETIRSCPNPNLDLIRKHPLIWKQFGDRSMSLMSLGESAIHATRRAFMEIVPCW